MIQMNVNIYNTYIYKAMKNIHVFYLYKKKTYDLLIRLSEIYLNIYM